MQGPRPWILKEDADTVAGAADGIDGDRRVDETELQHLNRAADSGSVTSGGELRMNSRKPGGAETGTCLSDGRSGGVVAPDGAPANGDQAAQLIKPEYWRPARDYAVSP